MKKRYLSLLIASALAFAVLCGCSGNKPRTVKDYLGNYSYAEPAVCMVYEPVEGETDEAGNPCYGVQYREITDLDGLLSSGNTLLIYLYSSMSSSGAEVTAAMEDVAQGYAGRLNVVMLDAMEYPDLIGKYEIESVPEFVLIKAGQPDQVFGSGAYDYWTVGDVLLWLQSNGVG